MASLGYWQFECDECTHTYCSVLAAGLVLTDGAPTRWLVLVSITLLRRVKSTIASAHSAVFHWPISSPKIIQGMHTSTVSRWLATHNWLQRGTPPTQTQLLFLRDGIAQEAGEACTTDFTRTQEASRKARFPC